jgi:hypothetical protein
MSVEVIGTLVPKNGGAFPVANAENVAATTVTNAAGIAAKSGTVGQTLHETIHGDYWHAQTYGSATADGVTVIDATDESVTWCRMVGTGPTAKWCAQAAWYVDAVNGSDWNSGASGYPVASTDEIQRRIGDTGNLYVFVTINIANAPTLIKLTITKRSAVAGCLIQGTPTTLTTDTVSAYTERSFTTGSNKWSNLTGTSITNWTAHIGKRIRLTSGTNSGAVAWVGRANPESLGNAVARISGFYKPPVNGCPAARVVPTVGNTFVVEDLPTAETIDLEYSGMAGEAVDLLLDDASVAMDVRGLVATKGASIRGYSDGSDSVSQIIGFGCKFHCPNTDLMSCYTPVLLACSITNIGGIGYFDYIGCLFAQGDVSTTITIAGAATMPMLRDCLVQGIGINLQGGRLFILSSGIFDVTAYGGSAIRVYGGSMVWPSTGLCGTGNTRGLHIDKGVWVVCEDGTPTITGTTAVITTPCGNFTWDDYPIILGKGQGTVTLTNGSRSVTSKNMPADAVILVARDTIIGTSGELTVPQAEITNPGTATAAFVIHSSSSADNSSVKWFWSSPSSAGGVIAKI